MNRFCLADMNNTGKTLITIPRLKNQVLLWIMNIFVLDASLDGKVIDLHENPVYGIVGIKCPEEYKDVSSKDIYYISKYPCLEVAENSNIVLKENHYYYDQLQYQLGVSCQSWCNFVLYTNKGLVVDRIRYNEKHWVQLKQELLTYYSKYYLPCLIKGSTV